MAGPAPCRSMGALATLVVVLVVLIGADQWGRRRIGAPTAPEAPVPLPGDGDVLAALVERAVAARWEALEVQMRGLTNRTAEPGRTDQQDLRPGPEAPPGRHLSGRTELLASFDAALTDLQMGLNEVRADMAALATEVDALWVRLKREKRARATDAASWEDSLGEEMLVRQTSVNQLEAQLRAQIQQLQQDVAAVKVDTQKASNGPTTDGPVASLTTRVSSVLATDTVLVPVKIQGPIIAPITGYSWRGTLFAGEDESLYERPIYKNISRESDDFWNYLLEELTFARVHAIMFGNRGCYNPGIPTDTSGPGNMCPRLLSRFVDAVYRAGAQNVVRIGMWDDTGFYDNLAGVDKVDLSDQQNWDLFWTKIQIFFDTFPQELWFRYKGVNPVIACWTLTKSYFSNQQGNASRLLSWLIQKFKDTYGEQPVFILQDEWFKEDTTIKAGTHALGQHNWFAPKYGNFSSIYSYTKYNNLVWGVTTPSFRDGNTLEGCGATCREVSRQNGATLINALNAGKKAKAVLTLLEGWTDMVESAGFYRSKRWAYPNQYINIVRQYADLDVETLRFEAEAADAFNDTTPGNLGNEYALRDLDVGALANKTGWYLSWIEAGEWIEFQQVQLGCGKYRFTVRAATGSDGQILGLGLGTRKLVNITLPNTGIDNYGLFHLAEVQLPKGTYNLRVNFETTGDLKLDWMFLKRSVKLSKCTGVTVY